MCRLSIKRNSRESDSGFKLQISLLVPCPFFAHLTVFAQAQLLNWDEWLGQEEIQEEGASSAAFAGKRVRRLLA